MRKRTLIGLAMVPLLLAVALRHARTGPGGRPEGRASSVQAQPVFGRAETGCATSSAIRSAQPVEPLEVRLPAGVEAPLDPDDRSEALEQAVEAVACSDLPALLDALGEDRSPGAADLRQRVVRRWAENDPAAAAAWSARLPEGPVGRAALEQVALGWAAADLPAAATWVRALPEGEGKEAATVTLAYEAARTEPITALELAGTLAPTRERDELLAHAVSQWAGCDAGAALAWVVRVPAPSLQHRLVAALAIALAEQDGTVAATLAALILPDGEEQDRTAASIVQRWAQTSPQEAASWIAQFPEGRSRIVAVQNLLTLWVAQDPDVASQWVRGLPTGALHDVAMAVYAQALAAGAPGRAAPQLGQGG